MYKISKRYKISNHGSIMSLFDSTKPYILKASLNEFGYPEIHLREPDIGIPNSYYTIHRLVALAFIPNPDNLPIVNHKNSNRDDPYFRNLEWTTLHKNTMHAIKYGNIKANLTYEQVHQVCAAMSRPGWTYDEILHDIFNTNRIDSSRLYSNLIEISNRSKYKNISKNYRIITSFSTNNKINKSSIHEICKLLNSGIHPRDISKITGVPKRYTYPIYVKRHHKDIAESYFK